MSLTDILIWAAVGWVIDAVTWDDDTIVDGVIEWAATAAATDLLLEIVEEITEE